MRDGEPKERLLAVRLPKHLLEALDQRVAQVRAKTPGVQISRSDLARFAILTALRSRRTLDLGKEHPLPRDGAEGNGYSHERGPLPPDRK